MSERFSDSVSARVPAEIREKFRFYNALLFIIVVAAAFFLMQSGWWRSGGWVFGDLMETFARVGFFLGCVFGGLFLILLSTHLPHLGSWMFYWWIGNPENRALVERAIQEMKEGRYVPKSRFYRLKLKFFEWVKKSGNKILLTTTIGMNVALIPCFFLQMWVDTLAGSYFSMVCGILFVTSLVLNFLVIAIAAGFYSHKRPENARPRQVIEVCSRIYIWLSLPTALVILLARIDQMRANALIKFSPLPGFIFVAQALFIAQIASIIFLATFMLKRVTPQFKLDTTVIPGLPPLKKLMKGFTTFILLCILLLSCALTLLITIVDVFMVISILSTGYLLLGLYLPVIFEVLKLVPRRPKKYSQLFWTSAKVGAIIVAVNMMPAIMTVTWTSPDLDSQFSAQFGMDWHVRVPATVKAKWRQVSYSAFEMVFGFNIPAPNRCFDVVYGIDSPRFVKQGDKIYANGSSKYTAGLPHQFTFDVYLPPGEEFGAGDAKYPTIIWFHGAGDRKGVASGNATIFPYWCNQGYVCIDLMYGYMGYVEPNKTVEKFDGYDFPDTIQHVGNFTHFLARNAQIYHADLSNIFFAGHSLGGWYATVCAYGWNTTFMGTNFSQAMTVRGCISFFGAIGILDAGSDVLGVHLIRENPYIRGSSYPEDSDYNPEWVYYNPLKLCDPTISGTTVCPTLIMTGTNDPVVPPGWGQQLEAKLKASQQKVVAGYYPLASHFFDEVLWTQYGQSVAYYMERFLGATRTY